MAPGSSWRVISYFSLFCLSRCHEDALVDETAWWARPPRDCDSDVYLSVVMVGRNDNYGGTFQSRLATSLRINLHLLNKHTSGAPGFTGEVLFVEWNPLPVGPSSAALLAEYAAAAARQSSHPPVTRVRVVTVPPVVHNALVRQAGAETSPPVLEILGKNVGVRRARGKFVLTTNPDDVLSASLVASFAKMNLLAVNFYRAARGHCDMRTWQQVTRKKYGANRDAEFRELDRCAGRLRFPTQFWDGQPYQVSGSCANGGLDKSIPTNPATHSSVLKVTPFAYAAGDFWLMARTAWHKTGGHIEAGSTENRQMPGTRAMIWASLDSASLCRPLVFSRVPQTTFDQRCMTIHLDHDHKLSAVVPSSANRNVTMPPFDEARFSTVLRAWNATGAPLDALEAVNSTSAARVARASAHFTAAWSRPARKDGVPGATAWGRLACKIIAQYRARNERLFDEQTQTPAPHLFGLPELSLPTAIVWPAGLHERDLGSCAAAPGK